MEIKLAPNFGTLICENEFISQVVLQGKKKSHQSRRWWEEERSMWTGSWPKGPWGWTLQGPLVLSIFHPSGVPHHSLLFITCIIFSLRLRELQPGDWKQGIPTFSFLVENMDGAWVSGQSAEWESVFLSPEFLPEHVVFFPPQNRHCYFWLLNYLVIDLRKNSIEILLYVALYVRYFEGISVQLSVFTSSLSTIISGLRFCNNLLFPLLASLTVSIYFCM